MVIKIKISLTEDAGYYVDQYNKSTVCVRKGIQSKKNLGKYLSKIKEVDTDGMNSARAKAQKSISDMVDYWSEDVTLDKKCHMQEIICRLQRQRRLY